MKYTVNTDSNGYILSIGIDKNSNAELDLSQYDFADYKLHCYRFINGKIILDEEKFATEKANWEAEQAKALEPTWEERIDAQLLYTALLTDSLLEE